MKLTKNYKDGNFINVIVNCENPGEISLLHQAVENFAHSTKSENLKNRAEKMLAKFQNREA